ncbi:MAG: fluoride efflux transporter CrcB [Oscillospiraceae bacterium]
MINCLFVGIGGFIGSVLRYLLGQVAINNSVGFPFATLIINFIGAMAIGILSEISLKTGAISPQLLLLLQVGLCGGFTTFSTFSLETFQLFDSGKIMIGAVYIALSVVLCVSAVALGKFIIKAIA